MPIKEFNDNMSMLKGFGREIDAELNKPRPVVRQSLTYLIKEARDVEDIRILFRRAFRDGPWTGLEGMSLPRENPLKSALREVKEAGFELLDVKKVGKAHIIHEYGPHLILYVYSSNSFRGEFRQNEERELSWRSIGNLTQSTFNVSQFFTDKIFGWDRFIGYFYLGKEGYVKTFRFSPVPQKTELVRDPEGTLIDIKQRPSLTQHNAPYLKWLFSNPRLYD